MFHRYELYFFYTHFYARDEEAHKHVNAVDLQYAAQCTAATDALYADLAVLYQEEPRALEPFCARLAAFTFHYIHLLEHAIWRIVDPTGSIPLARLLTPTHVALQNTEPLPSDCSLTANFFRVKEYGMNVALERSGNANMRRAWFPSAMQPVVEWMPLPLTQEYYVALDVNNVLK